MKVRSVYDYLRCAYHNKVSRAGYGLVILGSTLEVTNLLSEDPSPFLSVFDIGSLVFGLLVLDGCKFAKETFRAYNFAQKFIEKGLVSSLQNSYPALPYCPRVGFELAMRDSGLTLE